MRLLSMFAAALFASATAVAAPAELPLLKGSYFPIDPASAVPIYRVEAMVDAARLMPETIWIRTKEGEPRAKEILDVGKDGSFVSYSVCRYNLRQHAEVVRDGGELVFSLYEDGRFRNPKRVKMPKNFVAGPMVTVFIVDRRDRLWAGERIELSYAVPERQRLVGFVLQKDDERSTEEETVIKMSADSFFISMIVDPVYFVFGKGDLIPSRITGRVLPMEIVDGKATAVDATLIFENVDQLTRLRQSAGTAAAGR